MEECRVCGKGGTSRSHAKAVARAPVQLTHPPSLALTWTPDPAQPLPCLTHALTRTSPPTHTHAPRAPQVLGVSVDSQFSHLAWTQMPRNEGGVGDLKYPLVADFKKVGWAGGAGARGGRRPNLWGPNLWAGRGHMRRSPSSPPLHTGMG